MISLNPEEETAWLAGLLEGEGYFGTITNWVSGKGYRYARIGVNMTDRDVIVRAGLILSTKVHDIKAQGTGAVLPQFRLIVTGNKAIFWMKRLRPYMGSRRIAQIDRALAEYAAKPPPNQARAVTMRTVASRRKKNKAGQFIKN